MIAEAPPADATSREATPREPVRRLFFALWPDEPMRQAMTQATRKAARASGGRPVPAHNLHITLAFLGSVLERRLGELAEIARAAALPADPASASAPAGPQSPAGERADTSGSCLELVFDRLEYWRAAQLLCALPAQPPPAVVSLAGRLQDPLAARGFAPDLKSSWSVGLKITRQFQPHVTLARKVHRPPRTMEMEPVTWSFTDFVLVDSKTLPEGSVYTVLERFSFAG